MVTEKQKKYLTDVYKEFAARGFSRNSADRIIGRTGFMDVLKEYPQEQMHYSIEDAVDEIISVSLEKEGFDVKRAVRVKPLRNWLLLIRFDNGEKRVFNCHTLMECGLYSKLRDQDYFNSVHIDEMGVVCWDDSIGINPYELYENSENVIDFSF